jgi:hypothetical protein
MPNWTVSPTRRGVGALMRCPLTKVPFVLPKSCTTSSPFWRVSWAWRRLTVAS